MANIKIAISIDKPLLEQVDDLAHELNTSRSRIFVLAATAFIQRHKNLKLLDAINAAYTDFPDLKEASLRSAARSRHLNFLQNHEKSMNKYTQGALKIHIYQDKNLNFEY